MFINGLQLCGQQYDRFVWCLLNIHKLRTVMRHLRQLLQEESFYAMPGQSREVHALFTRIRLLAAGGEPQPATL